MSDKQPRTVFDMGCGTGTYITTPLAKEFKNSHFTASDSDRKTIQAAKRSNGCTNLTFVHDDELEPGKRFDLIIASEVIEHVEEPVEFLRFLRDRLEPNGTLILTLPNGYGPFEWASLSYCLTSLSGINGVFSWLRGKKVTEDQPSVAPPPDTLAISPHLNFFTFRGFQKVVRRSGMVCEQYRARTFLCGWLLDKVVSWPKLEQWNSTISDRLPAFCNSGWMFVLRAGGEPDIETAYRRNLWARWRKRMNEKFWGLTSIPLK